MSFTQSQKRVHHVMRPLRGIMNHQSSVQRVEVQDLYDAQVALNLLYPRVSKRYDDMFRVILKEFSDIFHAFKSHRDTLAQIDAFLRNGGFRYGHAYKYLIDQKIAQEEEMEQSIEAIGHALHLMRREKEVRPIIDQVDHCLHSLLEKLKHEIESDHTLGKKSIDAYKEIMDLRIMIARDSP